MPDLAVSAATPTTQAPTRAELLAEASPIVQAAEALSVTDLATHAKAQEALKVIAAGQARVKDRLDPLCDQAHKVHKGLTALRSDALASWDRARAIVNNKLDDYEREERRKAQEEQRRLEAQAAKEAQDRRIEEAILAEESGDKRAAEAILNEPAMPPPVIHVPTQTAKVEGVVPQTRWSAEITDPAAFVLKYLAAHPEETAMIQRAAEACLPVLNERARSQREALSIPGVRAVSETVRAMRAVR